MSNYLKISDILKGKIGKILAILVVFCINILLFSYLWILNHYNSDINLEVVLFHLRFPLVGANVAFIYNYILGVLLPSMIISVFFAIFPSVALILGLLFSILVLFLQKLMKLTMIVAYSQDNTLFEMLMIALKGAYFGSFMFNQNVGAMYVFKLVLCIFVAICVVFGILLLFKIKLKKRILAIMLAFIVVLNLYSLHSYFDFSSLFRKNSGNFLEQHYVPFNAENILSGNLQNRNVIIIFAESLEANFASVFAKNAIPNLYNLSNDNITFSHTQGFGGHFQKGATSWTIAGIIGYLCGIPLNAPGGISVKDFLPNAICISDVLDSLNYHQTMIMGSDDDFAAKGSFLQTHKIQSKDLKAYKELLPSDYSHSWGFSDSYLFAFAKEHLQTLAKNNNPFALYLLTNNTHFPDVFVESTCNKTAESLAENALRCMDNHIFDFISWIEKQDFYNNTTIIIVGDHLTSTHFSVHKGERYLYNVFINPAFSVKISKDSYKNRFLSHFDFTPLILDSLGIRTEAFGLGRNPLLKQTLLEIYNDDFEAFLREDSAFYDNFWRR